MKELKIYYYMRLCATALFLIGIGVALLLLSPYAAEVFDITVVALGLLTAVMNLPALFFSLRCVNKRGEWINLLMALAAIGLGVALMLLQTDFLLLLLGIYSVILPLIRIALVEDHWLRFKREIPRFLTGFVMVLIFLTESEGYILRFGAYGAFILTGIYVIWGIVFGAFLFSKGAKPPRDTQ
ncbi:MAG: hypothetical protein E7639_02915 [Ruminococcaceae bacterium]|nr:hypothetical protein [Oscillospiraceae bacterium]